MDGYGRSALSLRCTALSLRCTALLLRYILQPLPRPLKPFIALPGPPNYDFTPYPHLRGAHLKIRWVLKARTSNLAACFLHFSA